MTTLSRWSVVIVGVVLVIGGPLAVRSWPAHDSDVSAGTLLERVRSAADHGYSGDVQTTGHVQLAVSDRFAGIAALFGGRTTLRAWWRSSDAWRVDRLLPTGETDLIHRNGLTTEYSYEDAKASTSTDPPVRLPRTTDLLPPALAQRLLSGVTRREVSRLGARRVAGVDALGLRVTPPSPTSSISHLDLWADPRTGIPVRVELFSRGASFPALTSAFIAFSSHPPAPDTVLYSPTASTRVVVDDVLDIADAANQYAPVIPPDNVAGLARRPPDYGAVGIYGAGMSQLIAIPLRTREADAFREQLRRTPGVVTTTDASAVSVGPLGVLLTGTHGSGGWLVSGTVTQPTLRRAGSDLLAGSIGRQGRE